MNAPAQSWGSQQARLYRRARRDGASIEVAADTAGITLKEAQFHEADAAAATAPLPEAAFELLFDPATQPREIAPGIHCYAISTPEPVRAGPGQHKENTMARKARKDPDDEPGVIPKKDFETAIKLLMNDILPAQSRVGEFAQEMATAFKAIKKNCHIQPKAAKLAFQLMNVEEAKRDDFWRSLLGLVEVLKIGPPPPDLMDIAEGKVPGTGPAPIVARPRPQLVTLPPSTGDETDLADAGADVAGDALAKSEGFEADEAELGKQEGRGKGRKATVSEVASPPLH